MLSTTDIVMNNIIQTTYNINRLYCRALGDFSLVPWEKTTEDIINSMYLGVRNVIKNPDLTPEMSHVCWLNCKREEGWVYGPEKSAKNKTHPCIMPYSELPEEQRVKDLLFITVVRSLLKVYGLIA